MCVAWIGFLWFKTDLSVVLALNNFTNILQGLFFYISIKINFKFFFKIFSGFVEGKSRVTFRNITHFWHFFSWEHMKTKLFAQLSLKQAVLTDHCDHFTHWPSSGLEDNDRWSLLLKIATPSACINTRA